MRQFGKLFLSLLFPDSGKCLLCGQASNGKDLCDLCQNNLNSLQKQEFCRKCGKIIRINNKNDILLCQDCFLQNHPFTIARAFGAYKGVLKELIHQFKYTGRRSLTNMLANLMIAIIVDDKRFNDVDLIIPVPVSANKLTERRFNQSELLAQRIAEVLKINIDCELLFKVRDTASQSKLKKQERQINLKDAFIIKSADKIKGLKILLVDDILTTGSTVDECCEALLKAGAYDVKVITLATGEDKKGEKR